MDIATRFKPRILPPRSTPALPMALPTPTALPMGLPPHPPAHGCDELLNAWCDACCPERPRNDRLLARKLTRTEIKIKGVPVIFWGCFPQQELSLAATQNRTDPQSQEWSSNQCGILSEREPGRYKSGEQRLIEFALRKCIAAGAPHAPHPYAPVATSRAGAIAHFNRTCTPLAGAQAARRALAVAQGLHGYPYPPANGCEYAAEGLDPPPCPPPTRLCERPV